MPDYQSPGVYVEEVPSGIHPIVGVGTSTAGFIGRITTDELMTPQPNPFYNPAVAPDTAIAVVAQVDALLGQTLAEDLVLPTPETLPAGVQLTAAQAQALKTKGGTVTVSYTQDRQGALQGKTLAEDVLDASGNIAWATGHPIAPTEVKPIRTALEQAGKTTIKVQETVNLTTVAASALIGKSLAEDVPIAQVLRKGTIVKSAALAQTIVQAATALQKPKIAVTNAHYLQLFFPLPEAAGIVKLCTNFGEFKKAFGDFSTDTGQSRLAHAVYGFFNNGGTRCYVVRITADTELDGALAKLAAIDEIALVAAPGLADKAVYDKLVTHCQQTTQDRFVLLDGAETVTDALTAANIKPPDRTDYAAFYFPWLQVFDPATKIMNPQGDGRLYVPPSGHLAGIYARVDTQRGVHKAPANEVVLGALGLKYNLSKAQQDGLNPQGINCIRELNGNIRVWGARTVGGDANGEWKYISVRRLFLFLRESIDEGTQWVVFEPNTPDLWAKVTRNITAFLTNVWRAGALFGVTPQEAFYVKCDAETNPPELRNEGKLITEIGVAVTKPAEFVIFRLSQWAGAGQ